MSHYSPKILIVEDEEEIAKLIEHLLKKEGFKTEIAYTGEEAIKKLDENTYNLVILDLMLPKIQGLDICKYIRTNPKLKHIGVVILTVKSEEIDKVLGLELGADDYITKPFSPRELVARVKAVLRRYENHLASDNFSSILEFGRLKIDTNAHKVFLDEKEIPLSPIEYKILLFLALHPNKVFNRKEILKEVWKEHAYVGERTVDVHIKHLREKLEENPQEPKFIKTLRGVGYYFDGKLKDKKE